MARKQTAFLNLGFGVSKQLVTAYQYLNSEIFCYLDTILGWRKSEDRTRQKEMFATKLAPCTISDFIFFFFAITSPPNFHFNERKSENKVWSSLNL